MNLAVAISFSAKKPTSFGNMKLHYARQFCPMARK